MKQKEFWKEHKRFSNVFSIMWTVRPRHESGSALSPPPCTKKPPQHKKGNPGRPSGGSVNHSCLVQPVTTRWCHCSPCGQCRSQARPLMETALKYKWSEPINLNSFHVSQSFHAVNAFSDSQGKKRETSLLSALLSPKSFFTISLN